MYLGKIVETGSAESVYEKPAHPYTRCLLSAMPVPDPDEEANRIWQMPLGELPNPAKPPKGCHFHTRCPKKQTLSDEQQGLCVQMPPSLNAVMLYDKTEQITHSAACHFIEPDV
jgi:peptide/nickel transport system ATP-binding protein